MTAMALSGSAMSDRRSMNGVDNAPSLTVEWNAARTQFRVKVGPVYYGWFANTASERNVVLVV